MCCDASSGASCGPCWRAHQLTSLVECLYDHPGRVRPAGLGAVGSRVLPVRDCLGLGRGEGWDPLITYEDAKHQDGYLTSIFDHLVISVPYTPASFGFAPNPDGSGDLLESVARLMRAVPGRKPKLCLVGDSTSRNLHMMLHFGRIKLVSLPRDEQRAYMRGRPIPSLAFYSTTFSIDLPKKGVKCHRLCKARVARARNWPSWLAQSRCTAAIVEPATAHHVLDGHSSAFREALNRSIHTLEAGGQFNAHDHYTRVLGLNAPQASEDEAIASVLARFDTLTFLFRQDAHSIVRLLAGWVVRAPPGQSRAAVLRSPFPQHFPLTGEFTLLHARKTRVPQKHYGPFGTPMCGCQPLARGVARYNTMGKAAAFLRGALDEAHAASAVTVPGEHRGPGTNSTTSNADRVAFADVYTAIASRGDLGMYRAHVGCYNTGSDRAGACFTGLRSSQGRVFRDRVTRQEPPSERVRAFERASTEDFCDCTHYGFSLQLTALVSEELAKAVTRSAESS
mmetsp:Transcript_5413/g.14891  ORF Transcript_5413/g.14891 Transcript_5413/m.14891 type:complete len:508 (+) Transcript_5413:255-1778(+)